MRDVCEYNLERYNWMALEKEQFGRLQREVASCGDREFAPLPSVIMPRTLENNV